MAQAAASRPANRPKLLQSVVDAFRQADVRQKLLFTFALLVVFRFVANVPIAGINKSAMQNAFESSAVLGFLNLFSGGALQNLSVAALGVYPYITAQIILQILTPIIPSLNALSKEGEQGRNRIQLYTHWLTVPLAMIQSYGQLVIFNQSGSGVFNDPIGLTGSAFLPTMTKVLSMTAGTLFLVWLGELITEKGIGNGVSVIIFGGIVSGIPTLLGRIFQQPGGTAFGGMVIVLVVGLVLIYSIVVFQEATRKIPVQYARSLFRGGRMYRQSNSTHIPLKVNSAGMIPLIFAYTIIIFPATIAQPFVTSDNSVISAVAEFISGTFTPRSPVYWVATFFLVLIFTFFYTVVVFQQQNIAENLQKQGGFIPGIRPGRPTQEYITRVLTRITWAGAIFLGVVAIIPFTATRFFNEQAFQLSATGLLIVVGVVLDTMRQLEAQLLMRQYEGFIR